MTRNVRLIIGTLIVAIIALAVALGMSLANRDDMNSNGNMMSGSGYSGMMHAVGAMNGTDMLARMREVLGDEAFAQMQEHIAQHQSGQGMMGTNVDGMMHQMMDGMMSQMGIFGPATATPTSTPTP